MRLLYATTNKAKFEAMCSHLAPLPLTLYSLQDVSSLLPVILEDGNSPLENAKKKALAYYNALQIPLFSCDTGLYFDSLPDSLQPGTFVRRVGGKTLSDAEMTEYYSSLARKFGDLTARYKNAICLVLDEKHIYSACTPEMESKPFLITAKPHPKTVEGFPLDRISLDPKTRQYYYDLPDFAPDTIQLVDGFRTFFASIFHQK